MRNILVCLALMVFFTSTMGAQSTEELTALKTAKAAELTALEAQLTDLTGKVDALKTEVADLADKITPYPRWDFAAQGNIGINISEYRDWLSKDSPTTTAVNLAFTGNGSANLDQKKYFWRNKLNLTLGWNKFDDAEDPTDDEFEVASDAFTFSSLYGYKLGKSWAFSALGEFRSSVIENFNDPGYLDLGAGATWKPLNDLVVVIHPLNYNLIFSKDGFDYESSFGTKIMVDYKLEVIKHLTWTSNVSAFMSYKSSDLSNWTWINGLTTNVHGFGVGLDFGLRGNKQEALADSLTDNPLQTYWVFGLTYALGTNLK